MIDDDEVTQTYEPATATPLLPDPRDVLLRDIMATLLRGDKFTKYTRSEFVARIHALLKSKGS